MTAGMATKRPNAVVMSASAIPAETAARPPEPDVAMPVNALMMPDDRAEQPDERRRRADGRETAGALLHLGRGQGHRTVEGAADGADEVVAVLELGLVVVVFDEARGDDLRDVRLLVLPGRVERAS